MGNEQFQGHQKVFQMQSEQIIFRKKVFLIGVKNILMMEIAAFRGQVNSKNIKLLSIVRCPRHLSRSINGQLYELDFIITKRFISGVDVIKLFWGEIWKI